MYLDNIPRQRLVKSANVSLGVLFRLQLSGHDSPGEARTTVLVFGDRCNGLSRKCPPGIYAVLTYVEFVASEICSEQPPELLGAAAG